MATGVAAWLAAGYSWLAAAFPHVHALAPDRSALVRRGLWLELLTIGYNAVEAIVSVAAGFVSGSVALVSFGVDSGIEVTSSLAAHWRLRADTDAKRRVRVEWLTHRIIGWSFLMLAAYVVVESVTTLWSREAPEASPVGLAILVLSVLLMPVIAPRAAAWPGRSGVAPWHPASGPT